METLMAWLPSLLISLIAVAAFLYLAYQSRAQMDQQRRTLQEHADQLIEQFLQRESRSARRRLQVSSTKTSAEITDPERWLAHLRHCWLDAELAALVERGHHHSDYALLQKAALPLLRLSQRNDDKTKPAAKPRWNSSESREYLKKTRDTVSSQKQTIQEFKARKTSPDPAAHIAAQLANDAAKPSNFISSLGSVDNHSTALLEIIEKLERELAAAQSKYDAVSERLSAIETRKSGAAISKTVGHLTISTEVSNDQHAENSELLSEMESAYSNSISEMKKMSDINRQQRQLIFQMEKELSLLRKDTSEYQVSSEVLEKLKLQLRDYENCTTILEMESETLREQIQNLRKTIAKSDPSEQLTAEIAAHEPAAPSLEEKSALAKTGLVELIESISASESLERAGAQLIAWLGNQTIAAVVYIKGRTEQVWASSEGRVDDHSKQLLKSMLPIAGQPITEVREGIMFIYPVCRVLLYGKGDFHEKGGKSQLALRDTFSTTDQLFQLLQDKLELRHFHPQVAALQKKLHALAVQQNYIDAEHVRTGENFRKELDEYLLSAETTDIQRHCIDTMLKDFDSQLDILSKTGKLIATGLKVAGQDLAKLSESN
jgi:uncharacterized protein YccT (UPF0319 family)